MQGLPALRMFDTLAGANRYALLVARHTHHVSHMTILAHGCLCNAGRTLVLKFLVRGSPAWLPVRRQHELREGAFHVVVGEGGVQLRWERLRWIRPKVGQNRVGYVVACGTEVLALVITAVEHLVPRGGIGKGSTLLAARAHEILP